MKLRRPSPNRDLARRAFTLVEVMVMTGLFMLTMAGVLASHLYGLKMSARIGIKLGAEDDARQAIGQMIGDIRAANTVYVGSGDANGFTNAAAGTAQQGNCLLIYPGNTTNSLATNVWIKYYYSPAPSSSYAGTNGTFNDTNTLMRLDSGGGAALLTANYVTNNPVIFAKVDYTDTPTTSSNQSPYCVEITLTFIKLANPQVPIGGTNYFSSYQVLTRVAPRNQ